MLGPFSDRLLQKVIWRRHRCGRRLNLLASLHNGVVYRIDLRRERIGGLQNLEAYAVLMPAVRALHGDFPKSSNYLLTLRLDGSPHPHRISHNILVLWETPHQGPCGSWKLSLVA